MTCSESDSLVLHETRNHTDAYKKLNPTGSKTCMLNEYMYIATEVPSLFFLKVLCAFNSLTSFFCTRHDTRTQKYVCTNTVIRFLLCFLLLFMCTMTWIRRTKTKSYIAACVRFRLGCLFTVSSFSFFV